MHDGAWYQRTTWTEADAADFAARMAQVASNPQRAACLLAQTLTLYETGREELLEPALSLLDRLISECPDSQEYVSALDLRGRCLIDLGRPADALDAFRASMEAQRPACHGASAAYLGFGQLVIDLRRTDLYQEASEAMSEFGFKDAIPARIYRQNVITATIREALGKHRKASRSARMALKWADIAAPAPGNVHESYVRVSDPEEWAFLQRLASRFPDGPISEDGND